MTTDEIVIETVKCPDCGHDAKFMHAKDNTFGVLYCDHCEETAYNALIEQCKAEIVAEGTARAHKLIEEAF
jgi:hypothetical protein